MADTPSSGSDDSILNSIKKICGVETDYGAFDTDFITHINSFLMVVYQLGIGVVGFTVTDATQTWKDFLGDSVKFAAVKSFVQIRVRLLFDPPQSAVLFDALLRQANELEWRLSVQPEIDLVVPTTVPEGDDDD